MLKNSQNADEKESVGGKDESNSRLKTWGLILTPICSIGAALLGVYSDGKGVMQDLSEEAKYVVAPEIVALQQALLRIDAPPFPSTCFPADTSQLESTVKAAELLRGGKTMGKRPGDVDALSQLQALTATPSANAADWALLSLAHQYVGGATEDSNQAAAIAARSCSGWAFPANLQGNSHMHRGEFGAAITSYRAALSLDPSYPSPRFNLALASLQSGDPTTAQSELSILLEAHPYHPNARLLSAQARLQTSDFTGAIQDAQLVIESNGNDAGAHALLGTAFIASGDVPAGEASLCRAKALGHAGVPLPCEG